MKNSVKRFFSMIVALAMILSNMPLSLAEGLPEDTAPAGNAAPAVIELSGELAEENTESPAESLVDPVEPETAASSMENSDVPEEEAAAPVAEEAPAEEAPEEPAPIPAETEEASSDPYVPEEEAAAPAAEETPAEEEPEAPAPIPAETEEVSSGIEVQEEEAAVPAAEETPVEEEPEEPEILPVDATLLVGDSWRGTFSGERDTFLLRLTVKGQQAVHLATDGLPVSVNLSNEATGSSRVFACKYDNEMNAWNLISADFELTDGSYLMTVTPIQAGSTGAVTLSVFPQALVKEDPAEVGKPAEEKTPAGDETPAEEEAPAEDESPAGDEPTVENATPAEAGIPAADITPAEDKTPAEDEKPSEDETSAEDEQPAEKTEPVSDEASAAVTVVPEQSAEDEQPAEETKSEPSDEDTHIEGKTDVETGLDGETGEDGEPGAVEDGNAKAPAGEPEAAALIARVEGDDLVIEADGGILPANAQAAYQNYGEPDADSWIREWFGDNCQAEIHPQPLRAKMTKAAPVMLSPMNGSKAGYSMFSVSLIGAESAGDGVYSVTVRTRIDLRGGLDEDAVIDSVSYALYAINGDDISPHSEQRHPRRRHRDRPHFPHKLVGIVSAALCGGLYHRARGRASGRLLLYLHRRRQRRDTGPDPGFQRDNPDPQLSVRFGQRSRARLPGGDQRRQDPGQ